MKINQILMLAGVGIIGFAAYKYFSQPTPPPGAGSGYTYIPAGGSANGFINTTGLPTWVTATGVVLNAAGQILQSIPWNTFTGGGSGTTGGNNNPDSGAGSWQDINGAWQWVPNA